MAGMATCSHLMGLEVSVTGPAQREMIFYMNETKKHGDDVC